MSMPTAARRATGAKGHGRGGLLVIIAVVTMSTLSVPVDAQSIAADTESRGGGPGAGDSRSGELRANARTVSFPGHVAMVAGHSSPIERRNLLGAVSFEQGVSLWRARRQALVAYGAARVAFDGHGLDWNNKALTQAGLKYARTFSNGVVEAGGGYAYEDRFATEFASGQPIAFANYWFGWGTEVAADALPQGTRFPGSSWGTLGTHAPAEGQNLLLTVHLEQGVTAVRLGHAAVVPFASVTVTSDAAGHHWNNLRLSGQGVKLLLPFRNVLIETAVVYQQEYRWRQRAAAHRPGAFLTFRHSWNGRPKAGR